MMVCLLFVKKPPGIRAADYNNIHDIQVIQDEPDIPDAVQELIALLMDSSLETGRYAFLLCDDGLYWIS